MNDVFVVGFRNVCPGHEVPHHEPSVDFEQVALSQIHVLAKFAGGMGLEPRTKAVVGGKPSHDDPSNTISLLMKVEPSTC